MKRIVTLVALVTMFTFSAVSQTSVQKFYLPGSMETFYTKDSETRMTSNGDAQTELLGLIDDPSDGDEDEPIEIPGALIDVQPNPNGGVWITCRGNEGVCFEVNTISNYPTDNLVLVNTAPSTGIVSGSLQFGVNPEWDLVASINDVTDEGTLSESEYDDIESIAGVGGTTVYGYAQLTEFGGGHYQVICSPGPSWCLKYTVIPEGLQIF